MPKQDTFAVGGITVGAASATLRRTFALTSDDLTNTEALQVEGMKNLAFWLSQTVGAVAVMATPQFAVTSVSSTQLDWLNLSAPIALVPGGTPTILNFTFPARWIRLQLLRPAAQASTVQFVLAGSQ